ncbi:MAG TPA: hypothetical protein VFV38_31700 [Ktedonobacteraceae bacterium]|nr:hypothetical protein [Ktedonobacteraceae bacterium]
MVWQRRSKAVLPSVNRASPAILAVHDEEAGGGEKGHSVVEFQQEK